MTRHLLYLSLSVLLLSALLMLAAPAAADESKGEGGTSASSQTIVDYQTINSAGPLTDIFLGADISAQIAHADDTAYQVYPPSAIPADYGTFLVLNDTLYAPDFSDHGGTATSSLGAYTAFTQVSQSTVTGSGTTSDPFEVVTVVDVGSTGLRITQTDSYVIGQESYQTDIEVSNSGDTPLDAILYRAMDCYLGSDSGYGLANPAIGNVGCTENPNNTPSGRIEQLFPLTTGNQYYEAGYSEVWSWIGSKQPFPNTCRCEELIDNGMGISWNTTIPAGGQVTFSHLTLFSPTGNLPLTTSKTADEAISAPSEMNGYTIMISNTNAVDVSLNSIIDDLPTGFTFVAGSTTGATTDDPTMTDQTLTWSGPFTVTANSSLSLSFNVMVAEALGTYFNNATAQADGGYTVAATGDTAPITVFINQAPIAVDDTYTTAEDTLLTVSAAGVLDNDSEPDNDSLSASLDSDVTNGMLELADDGSFVYTPNENFNGEDYFSYIASDGTLSDTAMVTITVTAINDVPVAVDDTYTTAEDTPLTVSAAGVLDNDSDLDNDSLSVSLDGDVTNGMLELADDGSFVYTPNENFNGEDYFSYIASDGTLSDTAMVTITVTAINDAPVAVDDTYTTAEDTPLTVSAAGVLDNDSDLDNDSLSASLDSDVTNGMLELAADGSFVYTPNENFNGEDHFSYTASDGALSDTALVTIIVTSINDMPMVEAGDDQTVDEGEEVQFDGSFIDPGLRLATGVTVEWDFGDGHTATESLSPTHTYEDDGIFTVTLTVTDSEGGASSDTLLVSVNNVAPEVEAGSDITATAGIAIDFTGIFTDPGTLDNHTIVWDFGDGHTATDVLTPSHSYDTPGTITATLTVTDDDDGMGADNLMVIVLDGDGVDDAIEDEAPNNGDGNNDGILDSLQTNVASLPNSVDGGYVTFESPSGTTLVDITAVGNPSTTDVPEEVEFPQGLFEIGITGIEPGQSIVVNLILHTGEAPESYWKYGPTADDASDHWYLFDYDGNTGATMDGNMITLHFTDGERGDADLSANGQISDPGGPGIASIVTAVTLSNFDKQVTINWWAILALLSLFGIAANFGLRQVRQQ